MGNLEIHNETISNLRTVGTDRLSFDTQGKMFVDDFEIRFDGENISITQVIEDDNDQI